MYLRKKITLSLILATCIFSFNTLAAGKSLATMCSESGGQTLTNHTITNFNETEVGETNFKYNGTWYKIKSNANPRLHDFVKVSLMTGVKVDICLSGTDQRLMFIERTYGSN